MASKYRRMEKYRKAYRAALNKYEATGNRMLWGLVEYLRDRYARAAAEYQAAGGAT